MQADTAVSFFGGRQSAARTGYGTEPATTDDIPCHGVGNWGAAHGPQYIDAVSSGKPRPETTTIGCPRVGYGFSIYSRTSYRSQPFNFPTPRHSKTQLLLDSVLNS